MRNKPNSRETVRVTSALERKGYGNFRRSANSEKQSQKAVAGSRWSVAVARWRTDRAKQSQSEGLDRLDGSRIRHHIPVDPRRPCAPGSRGVCAPACHPERQRRIWPEHGSRRRLHSLARCFTSFSMTNGESPRRTQSQTPAEGGELAVDRAEAGYYSSRLVFHSLLFGEVSGFPSTKNRVGVPRRRGRKNNRRRLGE